MKAFCLFEQSGTFKNAFRKYGVEAEDYDVLNDFGQTDHVVDIFSEIEEGYEGKPSIFDQIGKDDICMAFFPCTRFEAKIPLMMRGEAFQQKKWTDIQKLECSISLQKELNELYILLSKMTILCLRKEFPMIIENPYTQPHYLRTYWCMKPALIDLDRTENGDYYKKPTQYWFLNCKPEQNLVFEPIEYVKVRNISNTKGTENTTRKVERSLMHPQYADRFIRQYILKEEQWKTQKPAEPAYTGTTTKDTTT